MFSVETHLSIFKYTNFSFIFECANFRSGLPTHPAQPAHSHTSQPVPRSRPAQQPAAPATNQPPATAPAPAPAPAPAQPSPAQFTQSGTAGLTQPSPEPPFTLASPAQPQPSPAQPLHLAQSSTAPDSKCGSKKKKLPKTFHPKRFGQNVIGTQTLNNFYKP